MKKRFLPTLCLLFALCLLCGCSGATAGSVESDATTQPKASNTPSAASNAEAAELIADISTTQRFTDEAVPDADIEKILTAGVNAPSAMNGQPWHFSAITDSEILQQIADDMSSGMPFGGMPPTNGDGNAPEMPKDAETPAGADSDAAPMSAALSKAGIADAPLAIVISCEAGSELDAGLTCQNMSVEAQLLGYGTKIVSSPTLALNGAKQAQYKELLGIPEDQTVAAVLLIGYADETVDAYASATARNPLPGMVTYVAP